MRPIVMCGIPRSGSTLVWQVLQEVFPDQKIPQTHPAAWEPDGVSQLVVTVRNPHDVAASLYRVRISRGGPDVGDANGLETILRRTELYFNAAVRLRGRRDVICPRYEDFVCNYDVIYDSIFTLTGIDVPQHERERINAKFSLASNRRRAAKLKDFNEKGEYEIHGDHIGPVAPGSWKTSLPGWALDRVKEVCRPIALEWGYDAE